MAAEAGISAPAMRKRLLRANPADPDDDTVVVEWVEGLDGRVRPTRRFDTTDRDKTIRRLRAKGKTIREIAIETECSVGTVHRVLAQKENKR